METTSVKKREKKGKKKEKEKRMTEKEKKQIKKVQKKVKQEAEKRAAQDAALSEDRVMSNLAAVL